MCALFFVSFYFSAALPFKSEPIVCVECVKGLLKLVWFRGLSWQSRQNYRDLVSEIHFFFRAVVIFTLGSIVKRIHCPAGPLSLRIQAHSNYDLTCTTVSVSDFR